MTNDLEYGPVASERELHAYVSSMMQALLAPGDPRSVEDICLELASWKAEVRVVRSKGVVAGGLATFRFGQWFGGKVVPSCGVGSVAIAPEHRGRGTAAYLMTSLVDELRRDGVAVSSLYPASQTLYRRAGYQIAGSYIEYRLPVSGIGPPPKGAAQVRLMSSTDHDEVAQMYRTRVRDGCGPLERTPHLWDRLLAPHGSRHFAYVLEHDGASEGYVLLTHRPAPAERYDVVVTDHVALTGRAAAGILGLIASHRSVADDLVFAGAPADPLLYAMAEQERRTVDRRTDWVLRVVDVQRSLELRGYDRALRGEVHFDISDAIVSGNHGRWVLTVDNGTGTVSRGGRGDLRIDVLDLAALYTGYLSGHDLRRLGRIEATDVAIENAAPLFRGPPPWMPEKF